MTDTPPDWVLIEAAKRSDFGWLLEDINDRINAYKTNTAFRALCDMIQKYEHPPVDRKLLCAREAYGADDGALDDCEAIQTAVLAIELWIEGYGE